MKCARESCKDYLDQQKEKLMRSENEKRLFAFYQGVAKYVGLIAATFLLVFLVPTLLYILDVIIDVDFAQTSALFTGNGLNPSQLLIPFTAITTGAVALWVGIRQVRDHEKRLLIDHATALAATCPDLIVARAGLKDFFAHVRENAEHYIEKKEASNDHWGQYICYLKILAKKCPNTLVTLSGRLGGDNAHSKRIEEVHRVLAFFEKSAMAVSRHHADASILWQQFNYYAIEFYVLSYPTILASHWKHARSPYLFESKSLGLPYEYYEAWLYRATRKDLRIQELLIDLVEIRYEVLNSVY